MRNSLTVLSALSMALCSCATPHTLFNSGDLKVIQSKVAVGEWRLTRRRIQFSDSMTCRLYAGNVKAFYQGRAIAFRFPKDWDVHNAVYRIDGGEPWHWRADLPELVRIGAPIDQGGIANASEGLVWIPWRKLADANRVAIQARADRPVRTFHLSGLKGLHQIAVVQGCAPDNRFVR